MPKIIENLENRLIEEARRQVAENGYSSMTIRSVAAGCGVGVGTVYNYFPSKEELLATFMLQDWNDCIDTIARVGDSAQTPEAVVRCIYDQLRGFSGKHQTVFQDPAAAAGFTGSFNRYHKRLRTQLAQPLEKFCRDGFASEFIAEAMLTWTMAGKEFEQIFELVEKLFNIEEGHR